MPQQILLVDDQQHAMQYHWSALERAGFSVTRCESTRQAVRAYNDAHFDLIILDRMLPPGEVLNGSETEMDLQTGYRLYEDLRQRTHLKRVPILIFTNFYEPETVQKIEENDERALVLGKDKLPSELVGEVKRLIGQFPVTPEDTVIPLTEHPNVAPYYAVDVKTGERQRIYFDYLTEPDPKLFTPRVVEHATPTIWEWKLPDVWQHYVALEDHQPHMLKAVLHGEKDEAESLQGIYFTGGPAPQNWFRDVLFEVAPWSRRDAGSQRRLRGVGKVMVARFIRQCLRYYGHWEPLLISGATKLNPEESAIGISAKAREFFLALGFTPDKRSPDILRLEHGPAMALLNEVSGRTETEEPPRLAKPEP